MKCKMFYPRRKIKFAIYPAIIKLLIYNFLYMWLGTLTWVAISCRDAALDDDLDTGLYICVLARLRGDSRPLFGDLAP